MAARQADAEAGWLIYREAGGFITRAQINASLTAAGRNPIADRTFRHYERLAARGSITYIPINQLDVDVARRRRRAS